MDNTNQCFLANSMFFIGVPSGFNTETYEPAAGTMGTTLEKQSLLGWDISVVKDSSNADNLQRRWE
jgi:hypothetical protein